MSCKARMHIPFSLEGKSKLMFFCYQEVSCISLIFLSKIKKIASLWSFTFRSKSAKTKKKKTIRRMGPSGPCYWAFFEKWMVPHLESRSIPTILAQWSRATCRLPNSIIILCNSFVAPCTQATEEMRIEKASCQ